MNKTVIDTIKLIAKENNLKINFDKLDTTLKDIGVDSLALLNLIFKVETKLDIQIENNTLVQIKNLEDLLNAFNDAYNNKNSK